MSIEQIKAPQKLVDELELSNCSIIIHHEEVA
jgi:hypothetical protein